MPSWERAAAKAAHLALYALILITPVAGWLSSSAHGFKTVYLGLLPIPDLLGKDKAMAEGLELIHSLLNKAIFFIVIAHAGAALKHHFLDRDEVLRRMLGLRGLLAAPLLLLALSAGADAQSALRENSSIEFISKQMGVPVTGIFREFEADVRFYPENPGKSRATVFINVDSIDAGSDEATSEIKRRVWLDSKNHPGAEFKSASLTPEGPGRYTVTGRITIKGRTQNVSAPFTVREGKGHRVFEGRFVLNRLDFAVGEGEWADTDTVDDEVEVNFRLHVPFEDAKRPK